MVLDAFCHKNTENNFENFFWTPLPVVWKFAKTHYKPKMKIIVGGCLIDEIKRFDGLFTMQKTPALYKFQIVKKSRKTDKIGIFLKNGHFRQ